MQENLTKVAHNKLVFHFSRRWLLKHVIAFVFQLNEEFNFNLIAGMLQTSFPRNVSLSKNKQNKRNPKNVSIQNVAVVNAVSNFMPLFMLQMLIQ